jgi:hypothetical protein
LITLSLAACVIDTKALVSKDCGDGLVPDRGKCVTDVDECAEGIFQCDPHAKCVNTQGSYNCLCEPGYHGNGKSCELTLKCVIDSHCDPIAVCTDGDTGFTCTCPANTNDKHGNGTLCVPMTTSTSGAGGAGGGETSASGGTTSSSGSSSSSGAGGGAEPFGDACPKGTVFTEAFTQDPVASGLWKLLSGTYSYDKIAHTLTLNAGSPNTQMWIGPRPNWKDYSVDVQITLGPSGNPGLNLRIVDVPNPAPNDSGDMYFAGFQAAAVVLGKEFGGLNGSQWAPIDVPPATFAAGASYAFHTSVTGNTFDVSVDGKSYISGIVDPSYVFGSIGLRTFSGSATYANLKVTCK